MAPNYKIPFQGWKKLHEQRLDIHELSI